MGYRITYGDGLQKTKLLPQSKKNKAGYAVVIAVLIFALILGSGLWRKHLPGDACVTERALHELVTDLREGETVLDAVTAFCKEILDNA